MLVDLLCCQRVQLSGVHVSIAMSACGGHPGSGWQLAIGLLYSVLELSPDAVDEVVYNSAINACKFAGQWQAAVALIYDMSSNSMACNSRSFSAAISACEKASEWESAFFLLGSMQTFSVQAEIFCYTVAIKASASIALWTGALALFQRLSEKAVVAGEVTYNTIIKACGNGNQWQRALHILEASIRCRVCTAETFNTASFGSGEAGAWKVSLSLLEAMEQHRVPADSASFNTAITICGRNSQWQRAMEVFGQVPNAQIDKVSFAAAISACDMGGQWQIASLLLEEAIKNRFLTPQCFTSAISACQGLWQKAVGLFSHLPLLNLQQGIKTYGAVINACCKADMWQMSLAFLDDMLQKSMTPGGHVGSLAESLTRIKGREATYALLVGFRDRQLPSSIEEIARKQSVPLLAGILEPKILKTGCYLAAIEKPSGIRTETLFQDFQRAAKQVMPVGYSCSLVSRLDLPTSGVLPIVLDSAESLAAAWYQSCFAGRLVSKDYLCLSEGASLGPVGTRDFISLPLMTRQLADGGILAVASRDGRAAHTEYEVLRRFRSEQAEKELMLLRAHPITGRTHQIRVHLAEIGRPIVGDATYGSGDSLGCRLFLHCHRISLPDFAGRNFSAVAELPKELKDLLSNLDENSLQLGSGVIMSSPSCVEELETEKAWALPRLTACEVDPSMGSMGGQLNETGSLHHREDAEEAPNDPSPVAGAGTFDAVEERHIAGWMRVSRVA
eukprot:Skav211983  [mRNA]  locus=scaffold2069:14572:18674:+ [translate_table: standard]